jgi:hypothetical protein
MALPAADPAALLDAFLQVQAQGTALPLQLYTRGEELYQRLAATPPRLPQWGRFLVAMGALAANELDDPAAASRFFLTCLQGAEHHGDHEAAVTAGYNQGVLQERRRNPSHARAAYRAAAQEGFRLGVVAGNTLRAATAAIRLAFAEQEALDAAHAVLAKQAWLGWLWLRLAQPEQIDRELERELGRQLCALLLPEDDPTLLAGAWRAWSPHTLATASGSWLDGHPVCVQELFAVAALAADEHLGDESADPGAPYRALLAAAKRS